MKKSSLILLVTFVFSIVTMFASNIVLKNEYDKLDKSDTYWTYGKILEKPFKHLVIEGGNITRIAFEPSATASVRVFKNWYGYEEKRVKALVRNDTLHLHFPNHVNSPGEKRYLESNVMVRIFSPELLSVKGHNTMLGLFKMKQKNYSIDLSGHSKLEVESYLHALDSLHINQRDSTTVVFAISPDVKGKVVEIAPAGLARGPAAGVAAPKPVPVQHVEKDLKPGANWETMQVASIHANVQGASLLDVGHAQVGALKLRISDTSGIILSGNSLKKLPR